MSADESTHESGSAGESPVELCTRGHALQHLERYDDALASYDRALAIRPVYLEALANRALVLLRLQRYEEALASCDQALAIKPRDANLLCVRGVALKHLRRTEQALASYDQALAIAPDHVETLINRGNALRDLRRVDDALASYDRALAINPGRADALSNRGMALREAEDYEAAIRCYAELLDRIPDYPFAKGQLLHAKMAACDWIGYEALADSVMRDVAAGKKSAEPYGLQAVSGSPRDLRRCAEIFASERFPGVFNPAFTARREPGARIRLGYLSGEFRLQATSVLMAELFELHDRNVFEVYAFDNGFDDGSEMRRRIVAAFDRFVDIGTLPDHDAATRIHSHGVDILVNLNGYFGRGRQGVFARRPCPIQVNYLGFPGTIGADYMDYIIADAIVIPPADRTFYTEKVVYLPDTYQVNDRKRRIAAPTMSRTDAGLPEDGIVFCCFNNNYKITPAIFDIWMRLLGTIPGSALWLLGDNPAAVRNLRSEAASRGIASDRLVFAPRIRLDEHLARHRLADLFLDTWPYNAHTTASDALWGGLPVLTCEHGGFAGRVAGSLLRAIGLPELITNDLAAYETLALKLARDRANLAEIGQRLLRNRDRCPLFDTDRFRRHIEAAYIGMWERLQRGEEPSSFAIGAAA